MVHVYQLVRGRSEFIGRLDIEPFAGVLELHVSEEMLRLHYGGDTLDDGRIRLQQVEGRSYVEVTAGAEHLDVLPVECSPESGPAFD